MPSQWLVVLPVHSGFAWLLLHKEITKQFRHVQSGVSIKFKNSAPTTLIQNRQVDFSTPHKMCFGLFKIGMSVVKSV